MCVRMRECSHKIYCLEIPRTTDASIISQFGIISNSNCFACLCNSMQVLGENLLFFSYFCSKHTWWVLLNEVGLRSNHSLSFEKD